MRKHAALIFKDKFSIWRLPRRIARVTANLLDRNFWKHLRLRAMGVADHVDDSGRPLRRRKYATYEAYVAHQRSKLGFITSGGRFLHDGTDLKNYDGTFRQALISRLVGLPVLNSHCIVLCLAARLGTEVRAFHDCGYFAVGVDLNPGDNNRHVLYGDFNNLVFPSHSIDVVYCNSIDHAFDLQSLFQEVRRVLRESGVFIAEVQLGEKENDRLNTGYWESISWDRVSDLEAIMISQGFQVQRATKFDEPWPGVQLLAFPDAKSLAESSG